MNGVEGTDGARCATAIASRVGKKKGRAIKRDSAARFTSWEELSALEAHGLVVDEAAQDATADGDEVIDADPERRTKRQSGRDAFYRPQAHTRSKWRSVRP